MENQQKPIEDFQIFDLWSKYKHFWPWFIVSTVICCVIAALYIWFTPKTYLQSASVMVSEDKSASELSTIFSNQVITRGLSVKNEVEVFKSPLIVQEVVLRLNLTTNYTHTKKMRTEDLYAYTPIKASFPGSSDDEYLYFQVEFASDSSFILSKFTNGEYQTDQSIRGKFHDTIPTPYGNVVIEPTGFYGTNWYFNAMEVSKYSISAATKMYVRKLSTSLVSKENSIIRLDCADSETSRARDFLDMLLIAYNDNWLMEKNKAALQLSQSIDERLPLVEKELKALEDQLQRYKSQHLLTDVKTVGSLYTSRSASNSTRIMEINSQISMVKYAKDFLNKNDNINTLLPFNSGLGNTAIESQIANYNSYLMNRDELLANSSENNPTIVTMNEKLRSMLLSISQSIDNQIVTLNMQLSGLQAEEAQMTRQIASNPGQELFLQSIEREYKNKEAEYMHLMQKKIENDMSLVITATNTRLISPPSGSSAPVSPKKKIAMIIALFFGVGIPGGVILGKEYLNLTIREKKDLDVLSVPMLGVISLANKTEKDGYLHVREDGKDSINETFRMVRTNLDAICNKNLKVVMFTSLEPGSGKTFVALNLAMTLALAGKKIALVDLDLRTSTLSSLISMPEMGIIDFLNERTSDEHYVIQKEIFYTGFDIIPVGVIPHNPTEMLMSDRFKVLIEKLKTSYDYIFLDSTPLDMVADATIVAKYADVSVFVVREGHTDRRKLPKLEETYQRGHFKKMMLILNGAKQEIYFDKHHAQYSNKVKNVALLPREAYSPGKTKYITEGTRKNNQN